MRASIDKRWVAVSASLLEFLDVLQRSGVDSLLEVCSVAELEQALVEDEEGGQHEGLDEVVEEGRGPLLEHRVRDELCDPRHDEQDCEPVRVVLDRLDQVRVGVPDQEHDRCCNQPAAQIQQQVKGPVDKAPKVPQVVHLLVDRGQWHVLQDAYCCEQNGWHEDRVHQHVERLVMVRSVKDQLLLQVEYVGHGA